MTHKITLAEVLAAAKPKTRKRILSAIDGKLAVTRRADPYREPHDPVVIRTVTVDPVDGSYEAFSEAYDAALKKLEGK